MRRPLLTRLVLGLAIILVFALVASAGAVIVSVRRSLPTYDGRAALPGLTAKVDVRRDTLGVPQIYADSSEDLFRAQGYVHAQDRFFEMDFRRHLTAGRLAEWFGRDLVETDALVRTLGWRRVAEREFPLLSVQTRGYLNAYADGVNAYLAEHSGSRLSVEYTLGRLGPGERPEAWTPVDSLAWLKAMAWDLRANLDDEIDRALASTKLSPPRVGELYPAYPFDRHTPIVADRRATPASVARSPGRAALPAGTADALRRVRELLDASAPLGVGGGIEGGGRGRGGEGIGGGGAGADGRSGLGSNSWVIAGKHTSTGKPLLANDPHLAPTMPSVWHQTGLHCRQLSPTCRFDVAGFGFAGVPGVVIGHNHQIAWGFTNLGADVMDLYVERLDGNTYMYDGEREPLSTRRELIGVKGEEPVGIEVRATRHGPLLSDVHDRVRRAMSRSATGEEARKGGWQTGVSLRWTALEPGRTAEAIFRLNAARDWTQFRSAAELLEVPAQNLVYADVDGHIGYQAPGRIPVRREGTGEWAVPGWTTRYEWDGWVPFDKLPSVLDPEQGYLVTANQSVAPASYPYRLTDRPAYGYRSDRIGDLIRTAIKKQGKVDTATMLRIQADTYNANAAFLVPYLQKVKVDGFTAQAQELFAGWDFRQGVDSAPAAYFNAVWRHLLALTFRDEISQGAWPGGGDRWYEVVRRLATQPDSPWWDDVRTKKVREDRDTMLAKAMVRARAELTKDLAKDPTRWRWGKLHQLELVNSSFGSSGIGPLERLFNRGPYEVAGGSDAVLATGWDAAGEDYSVTSVPSMRMVVDLADLDRSRWINLTGVSGHPSSPHYNDQIEEWVGGKTVPWAFTRRAVTKAAGYHLVLAP
ncbi:penicillin acylase family protein [Actinopolymorpha sp. B17G11]|uniref:penicillin acylase family protein n=1 Tax=Actinopolymorpha sp. B17G11 TaxID=3160861 RepID=UPI0032E3B00C